MPCSESTRAAVVVLLLALAVCASAGNFDPWRTHVIDHVGNNWMFRGNEPLNGTSFAYDQVVATFREVAKNETGMDMPASFAFLDFSLLVPLLPEEEADILVEKAFFDANPTLGAFTNWPLLTDYIGPCSLDNATRNKDAASGVWDIDNVPYRVSHLHELLNTLPSPTAIYFHCEAGTDRTGEISGAYLMQYAAQSFARVLAFDDHIESRNISTAAMQGLEWYALYLQLNQSLTTPNFSC